MISPHRVYARPLIGRILATLVILGAPAVAAAQIGRVTAVVGSGELHDPDGHDLPWAIGSPIDEGTELRTGSGGFAMLFFVSGLGAADLDFDGVIVVEVDQDTQLRIRSGPGRRAPIDIHVIRGGVQAFFDAREHREYILLSTPLGRMQVAGSNIYATHGADGSVFGTFDSPCEVVVEGQGAADAPRTITSLQKVVVNADAGRVEVRPMVAGDSDHWAALPDFHMAAALSSRPEVTTAYADRAWVAEYVVSGERLEDVAREGSSNIPTQEPVVANAAPPVLLRALATALIARQSAQQRGLREFNENERLEGRVAIVDEDTTIVRIERSTGAARRPLRPALSRSADPGARRGLRRRSP